MNSKKTNGRVYSRISAIIVFATLASCALPTAQLTQQQVTQLNNSDLCGRYAFSKKINESVPLLETERRRRGLSCRSEIDSVVGNCSSMRVVSYGPVAAARGVGNVYTVRNNSDRPRRFRINHSGISSSEFTIRSNSTEEFGVGTSRLTSAAGEAGSGSTRPTLLGCQAI